MNDKNDEKKLVVNTTSHETRIAMLENNMVTEVFIERSRDLSLVGNIYKGVVTRVLPGMNAAFLDLGLERSAFLYGGDCLDPLLMTEARGSHVEMGSDDQKMPDNRRPIEEVLREGQQIIVQISKEPLGTKGPRVTMHLTVPGRFLVLMPRYSHVGISRRIAQESERQRLRAMVLELAPKDIGVIVRTAAQGVDEKTLRQELIFLNRLWQKIGEGISLAQAPSQLYCDLDLIKKTIRDLFDDKVQQIIVDDPSTYTELKEFFEATIPAASICLELYKEKKPIFDCFSIEDHIARALGNRVELFSGGYLIIDQTEALTSFDVNTGKFVGKTDARQTILKTNLEASRKVVEQLRMRNIGGIIIVDFIDMSFSEDQAKVFEAFTNELKSDRARTNILKISELGLVEMTRKRTSESLERQLTTPCPHCEGLGRVRSIETQAQDLLREIVRFCIQNEPLRLDVRVRPDIHEWVMNHACETIRDIQSEFKTEIKLLMTQNSSEFFREPGFEVKLSPR